MEEDYADYEMLEELGSGSFGVVYKARERSTGELVAIKHIDLDGTDDDILDIQQEIALLSTCSSPFVTQYKTSFVRGVKLWIVMEYLGGGSCLDLIRIAPFTEDCAAIICRELLLGLDYLHRSGKIHRDIKAANILLSHTGKVKIADFGVAAQLTNIKSVRNTFVGTPFWMAPEVIREMGYDFKADIWSLGITTMELVNGEPPNSQEHPMKALLQIPKNPAPRLEGHQFSRDVRSFVASCLIKDPEQRPTAKDLLQHRFIQRAGKVEALRDLIRYRQRQQAKMEDVNRVKYYEETLRDLSAPKDEDDWVFDTIKPITISPQKQTIKKRKLSQIAPPPGIEAPSEMLRKLNLNAISQSEFDTQPSPPTVRNIRTRTPSGVTARKISSSTSQVYRVSSNNAPLQHSASPSRQTSAQRQPLAIDMSFGNGQSTTRPFRRVSDESTMPNFEKAPVTNENLPPTVDAVSKEARLGRRLFGKIIDPAVQEAYAQTATKSKQEVISKVGEAWAALDALDPEGELLLLKSILDRVNRDAQLCALLPPPPPTPQQPPQPLHISAPTTPQKPKQQSNHEKQRQPSQISLLDGVNGVEAVTSAGMPGQSRPGMEHETQLADALYERWLEGLRTRWPKV